MIYILTWQVCVTAAHQVESSLFGFPSHMMQRMQVRNLLFAIYLNIREDSKFVTKCGPEDLLHLLGFLLIQCKCECGCRLCCFCLGLLWSPCSYYMYDSLLFSLEDKKRDLLKHCIFIVCIIILSCIHLRDF